MLKFLFWILLLANGGLFAYQQGFFDALLPSGREPARMKNQFNADKIKVIAKPEPKPEPKSEPKPEPKPEPQAEAKPESKADAKPEAKAESKPEPKPEPKPQPKAETAPPPPVAKKAEQLIACTEVGNFNPEDAKRFKARLAPLDLGDRLTQRPVQEVATHMVYIPSQGDKEGAERKAAELRRLGINDYFIIQDNSSMRWAISLGVFRLESAARAHLVTLIEKGVRTARIAQRTVSSKQVALQLHNLNRASFTTVEKAMDDFPNQEMRKCEAAKAE